jgi:hypothetical protein
MKKIFLYLVPLLVAFILVVVINEYCRRGMDHRGGVKFGQSTMNTALATPEACSWACYDNTAYCKQNHVKVLNKYFSVFDPLYFGMICALKQTGNYGAANVIFLVILWPSVMSFLLVRFLINQSKIRLIK